MKRAREDYSDSKERLAKKLNNLLNDTPPLLNTTRLSAKVTIAYRHNQLGKLQTLFNSFNSSTEHDLNCFLDELILFLKDNWSLVHGTILSYTASPQSEITLFLCDIAEYVATTKNELRTNDETPPVSALLLLIPTLHTESCRHEYPSLDALNKRVSPEAGTINTYEFSI